MRALFESVTEKLALLSILTRSRKEEGAGRGGMFICSKLRQNLSEIQDRTLERIQKVIWDHLLALKGEIIQKQALFLLPFRTPNNSRVVLINAVCSVFSSILFSTSPRSFFRLNHVRKAWN